MPKTPFKIYTIPDVTRLSDIINFLGDKYTEAVSEEMLNQSFTWGSNSHSLVGTSTVIDTLENARESDGTKSIPDDLIAKLNISVVTNYIDLEN